MNVQEATTRRLPDLKERHLPENCRETINTILKETYGYEQFRNLEIYDDLSKGKEKLCISQGQLIENVILEAEKAWKSETQVDNILLTAPTGSGKSLLFQLPAIYLGKEYNLLTIVVSPLKALIVDQVESLQELGYARVAYASSDLSPEQKMEVYRQVREGEIDLFYLSPELLLSYDIKHFVGERRIGLVVVDEAHTVTTWGKEFRVDYWFLGRYLTALKQTLGYNFPLFALTATAVWNPKGGNDMIFETIRSLQMEPCVLYVGGGCAGRGLPGRTQDIALLSFCGWHRHALEDVGEAGRLASGGFLLWQEGKGTESCHCAGVQGRDQETDCGYESLWYGSGH